MEFAAFGTSRAKIAGAAVGRKRKDKLGNVFLAVSIHDPVLGQNTSFDQSSRNLSAISGSPVFNLCLRVHKFVKGLARNVFLSCKL